MNIQLNNHNQIMKDGLQLNNLISSVGNALKLYESFITKIEVQLSHGEVKNKEYGEVECRMEARLKDRSHIDVENRDNNIDLATSGAIQKLNASLESLIQNIHHC